MQNPDDDKQIKALKKYISAAGLKIQNYATFWEGCNTKKARVERMKEFLEKKGIHGRPTLEKCAKAKKKRQISDEVNSLDKNNIISEGKINSK